MATLGNLYSRIYEETHQTRTTAVANAVNSAVAFYKSTRFWCNEDRAAVLWSLTTQYTLANAFPKAFEVDHMYGWWNSFPSEITQASWHEIVAKDDGKTTGVPGEFAILTVSGIPRVRVYPKPSATATVEALFLRNVTLSASASHSSCWTNELEPLVRARAKAVLYADFYGDPEKAMLHEQIAGQYLKQFLDRTAQTSNDEQLHRYL